LWKIPVLRLNFPRHLAWEIFRLSTGIFRKYPSQTWYICIIYNSNKIWKFIQIDKCFTKMSVTQLKKWFAKTNKLHSKINFCEKCSPLIPHFSTYYVIYIDYYMAFFISYPLSAWGHDISPRADRHKGWYMNEGW
jgi:hypothetical protein